MHGLRGARGGGRSTPGKKDKKARRWRVVVLHTTAPEARLRLERALEILLGAPSCSEEKAPDQQTDDQEDQGSQPHGDGDAG